MKSCNILNFRHLIIFALCLLNIEKLSAQNNSSNLPSVYFTGTIYDSIEVKNQIPFIEWVNEEKNPDIVVEVTEAKTDGKRYHEITFTVRNNLFGQSIKINSFPREYSNDSLYKSSGLNVIKLGLADMVAKTHLKQNINVEFVSENNSKEIKDKWNNWLFEIGTQAYLSMDQSYSYQNYGINMSANRLTDKWKILNSYSINYSKDAYDYEDYSTVSENQSTELNHLLVKSINDYISIGEMLNFSKSSYQNLDFSIGIFPAIEFNLFKYSESTKKLITFRYSAGYRHNNYTDTTIYEKTFENLFQQSLNMQIKFINDWGSISTQLGGSNYLHNFGLNSLNLSTYLTLRITKKLMFNISGGASLIHDQIGLIKGVASTEDILLRQRELQTSYRYWGIFGISFTFGSTHNSAVNPRFNEL